MKEEWREIPNFSRYKVSNKGTVIAKEIKWEAMNGTSKYTNKMSARKLKPRLRYDGRLWIPMKNDEGKKKQMFVAHIVAECFIPNPDKCQYVGFKDDNMTNCGASNLFWTNIDPRVALDDYKVQDLPNEEWRAIKDYPNYMVSNYARVKSIATIVEYKDGRRRQRREKLKPQTYNDGYVMVRLFNQNNERGVLIKAHRLVAGAFIPNPENKPYIDHINAVRDDNRIENLRWVTHEENMNNPITRERNRIKTTERMKDTLARKRISEAIKQRYKDPEYKAKVLAANRTEEVRRKRRLNGTHKNVLHYDENGNFIEGFLSTVEAGAKTGYSQTAISQFCRGKLRPKNNHIWRYE